MIKDHIHCGYYGGRFCYSVYHGTIWDSAECKVSLENCGAIFGKLWIAERYATYDAETCILKFFSCDQWCGLKTLPQQPIPKVPSSLEETTPKEDSSLEMESSKDHGPAKATIDLHDTKDYPTLLPQQVEDL